MQIVRHIHIDVDRNIIEPKVMRVSSLLNHENLYLYVTILKNDAPVDGRVGYFIIDDRGNVISGTTSARKLDVDGMMRIKLERTNKAINLVPAGVNTYQVKISDFDNSGRTYTFEFKVIGEDPANDL